MLVIPGAAPALIVPRLKRPDAEAAAGASMLRITGWTDGSDPYAESARASECRVLSVFEELTGGTAGRPRSDVRRVSVWTGILGSMTESPQLVKRTRDWISSARSFHARQLTTHRRVRRLGKTRLTFTTGQALTNLGAFFLAGSTGTATLPDWAVVGVLVVGFLLGRFLFPIPVSSIASRRGPSDVVSRTSAELDRMTPQEIRIYENNMVLKHRLKDSKGLGAEQALQRQREAIWKAEEAAGAASGSLRALSLVDAHAFSSIAAQHKALDARWLAYEVDPKLQFDYPAMSDAAFPTTSVMIRARLKAEQTKSEGNTANYRSAVAAFRQALSSAEAAAGVPRT